MGKSTLLNTLVGTKIAITTNKPQTTRDAIHGIVNDERGQIVFIDTPGILKHAISPLSGSLLQKVKDALHGIDVIIYVVDPHRELGAEERYTLSLIRESNAPKFLVINKMDQPDKTFLEDYRALADQFAEVFEISALRGSHIAPLKDAVFAALTNNEPAYPPDQWTNLTKEQWIAELIREKIFNELRDEVPYLTHVVVDSISQKQKEKNKPSMFVIQARVITAADRYKKMIVGAGGRKIKEVGSQARKELEAALNARVFLELDVETNPHWMRSV